MTDSSSQICGVATRYFARQGFAATSLQSIADEVGMSKPSLLYHYPSKDALREAVIANLFAHWRSTLPQLLAAVTDGERRFEALTQELIRFFASDPDRARLLLREFLDRPDTMREQIALNMRPWVLLVSEYINKGKHTGEHFEDVDAESYILHVVSLVVTSVAASPILAAAFEANGKSAQDRHLEELVRLVRSGLFRDPT